MDWFDDAAVTLAVFLPLLGAVAVAVLPRDRDGLVRGAALTFSGLALASVIVKVRLVSVLPAANCSRNGLRNTLQP